MAIEERQYQQDAIESLRQGFRVGHRRQVLSASTGAGKSVIMLQMIKAAQDKGSKIVFICERRVLVEQFSKHLDAAGIDHGVLMAKHWRFRPDAQVQVATAQTLERMETWPAFDICFVDEIHACFVAGTLIDGKPIETLCVGDLVTSMNHETGLVEIKQVTEIFKHLTLETVTVKTDDGSAVTCTKSHPIYTQDGYVDAVELSNDSVLQSLKFIEPQGEDHVCEKGRRTASMPPLQSTVCPDSGLCRVSQAPRLASVLPGRVLPAGKGRVFQKAKERRAKSFLPINDNHEMRVLRRGILSGVWLRILFAAQKLTGLLREIIVPAGQAVFEVGNQPVVNNKVHGIWWYEQDAQQQSNDGRCDKGQGPCQAVGDWPQARNSWRKRNWLDKATSLVVGTSWERMGTGGQCQDRVQEGRRVSDWTENRHCVHGENDSHRSGWSESQLSACKRPGRAQGFFTEPTRVVSVTLQEPGSDAVGSTDFTALQSIEVFNLEVEGNHNYFANGLLVHNCLRTSLKRLFNNRPDLRVIGATATPFHPEMGHYFSAVTSVITMKELVDKGYLVPYRVFIAHEIDTAGVKVVAGEWQKDELEKRGQQIVGDVVADYIRISNEVWGEQRKTICFSCGIAHGAELVRKFVEADINAVQISSNDEDEYRAEVLADFAKPDTDIKVIVSVAILSRGFDQPDVHHVILARPLKKSFSEHVQQMGRVARPYPGKAFAIVQDHSGNYLRFQASFDKLYNEGVKTLDGEEDKKSREEPTPKEKEASKCPACGHLWGGADVCPHCGHVRTRRNDVVSIAGVMKEITVSNAKPQVDQIDWYAQAIGYAEEHGKKPGFAYYKFKEKFKTDPPAIKPAPKHPTPAVANWFRSRAIAYAKGMAKGRMQ